MWTAKTDQTGWMPRLIWVFAGRTFILFLFFFMSLVLSCRSSDHEECFQSDKTHAGGIVMYLADYINYERRKDLETPDIESIWTEVRIQNGKYFLICSVYRPLK